jgi:hypothetical protein
MSSFANVSRLSPGYLAPDAGPFDSPQDEPIILDDEILWELRDDESTT